MDEKKPVEKDEHEQSIYWRYYTEEQREKLRSMKRNELNGEINIMRILLMRFIKREAEAEPKDRCQTEESLRAKSIASMTLSALQKIQVNESAAHPEWEDELEEAYRQAREEMGINDYLERLEPPEEKENE